MVLIMSQKGYMNDSYKQFEELNEKLDKLLSKNKIQTFTIVNLQTE